MYQLKDKSGSIMNVQINSEAICRDDLTGQVLDPELVRIAIAKEFEYFENSNPNIRNRLVARQIRQADEDAIFAPTPPLEALRSILSIATTDFPGRPQHVRDPTSERRTQVSAVDISRA